MNQYTFCDGCTSVFHVHPFPFLFPLVTLVCGCVSRAYVPAPVSVEHFPVLFLKLRLSV